MTAVLDVKSPIESLLPVFDRGQVAIVMSVYYEIRVGGTKTKLLFE